MISLKKTVMALFSIIFLAACGTSVQVVKKQVQTRPYTVNIFYTTAEKPVLSAEKAKEEYKKQKKEKEVKDISSEDAQKIKLSILNSIESNKLFKQVNQVASKEALEKTPSDYNIILTYSGGTIAGGGLDRNFIATIVTQVEVVDRKNAKTLFKKELKNFTKNVISASSAINNSIEANVNQIMGELEKVK